VAKYSNTITYGIKTSLDKSGIASLQAELQAVNNTLVQMQSKALITPAQAQKAVAEIGKVRDALTSSFDSRVGMLNLNKFNSQLSQAGITMNGLYSTFSKAGAQGQRAFTQMVGQLNQAGTSAKAVSTTMQKIVTTIGNTARWGVIASAFQEIMNSVREAVEYVEDLDESLTNIMMVTDYSREAMNDYAKSANEAAKAIGSTTTAMTNATLVFAQQGYDLDQSSQLAELSTKLANASQQDTATTSDQITAYMNAYGMADDMEALSAALDSWAEVANISAADVEELATASQKAASTANTVGVSMDQLAAQIATIESVTKDAPENIGPRRCVAGYTFSISSMGFYFIN
jgi:chromosome segregation ATPase